MGDLRVEAKALEQAGSDALEKGDLETAAADFRDAANKLRTAGDFGRSAFDSERAGAALETEGQAKETEVRYAPNKAKADKANKEAENAYEGAARNYEAAARTALQGNSHSRFSQAQSDYSNAGFNRNAAGVIAEKVNKLEVEKNYRRAGEDYGLAKQQGKDAARTGNKDDAARCDSSDRQMNYSEKADLAEKAADAALRALKDPKNKLWARRLLRSCTWSNARLRGPRSALTGSICRFISRWKMKVCSTRPWSATTPHEKPDF
jgi:hypothetical protein